MTTKEFVWSTINGQPILQVQEKFAPPTREEMHKFLEETGQDSATFGGHSVMLRDATPEEVEEYYRNGGTGP